MHISRPYDPHQKQIGATFGARGCRFICIIVVTAGARFLKNLANCNMDILLILAALFNLYLNEIRLRMVQGKVWLSKMAAATDSVVY